MRFLSLNCQKAYNGNLGRFLHDTLQAETYDFLVLQEVTDEVLPLLAHDSYKLLTAHNEAVGAQSHLCVVYRDSFTLLGSKLIPIESFNRIRGLRGRPGYGLLYGDFACGDTHIRVGSIHLHSGLSARARSDGLRHIRSALHKKSSDVLMVVGGDCNFGPFEKARGARIMSPHFACVTERMGPTLNSRYTEPAPNGVNTVAAVFGKVGLGVRLATDHFFVGAQIATLPYTTRILPDRVSDHSPIELVFGK